MNYRLKAGWAALLCLVLWSVPALCFGQAADPDAVYIAGRKKLPELRLELVPDRAEFALGEPIRFVMRYTYTGKRALTVAVVKHDYSGRVPDFDFSGVLKLPGSILQKGRQVADPIPWNTGMGGGARTGRRLTPENPYEQTVVINEWLRFDGPGRYRISARSRIVHLDDSGSGANGPIVPIESEPATITITEMDPKERRDLLAEGEKLLKSEQSEDRKRAAYGLRMLMDPGAIPGLVEALEDEPSGAAFQSWLALRSFADPAPVQAELQKALDDRFVPVSARWFYCALLAESELRRQGLKNDGMGSKPFQANWEKHQKDFDAQFLKKIELLPEPDAARASLDGLLLAVLPRTDTASWKRVLNHTDVFNDNQRNQAASLIADYCRDKTLIPLLKAVAAGEMQANELRSAAVVALYAMGDTSSREMVARDIVSASPVFSPLAYATLGNYHAKEIAEALLGQLLTDDFRVREPVAARLRDFGQGAQVDRLRSAMQQTVEHHTEHPYLLEALALKSPPDALPFIRAILQNPATVHTGLRQTAIHLVSRMTSRAARATMLEILHSPEESDRREAAQNLYAALYDARAEEARNAADRKAVAMHKSAQVDGGGVSSLDTLRRRLNRKLPADPAVAGSFLPELLKIFQSDPSPIVRAEARTVLAYQTGIPADGGWQATRAQQAEWPAKWQEWWRANALRYKFLPD